jgi:hypothetical protein
MKKIYYLKEDENQDEKFDLTPIKWTYRLNGKKIYSQALKELVRENMCLN